ncbi:peptidylprolyl isomerase [Candidatus Igneacidithiobacillus taiwanensis]|uniref:peptidylprolyl isomerase n=1 Tax=Candidatus Igneacidithiobacillus taiwanensis TaxID=1945924 RepID=UPI00289C6D9A|nr:peptidylprolyl isomerase [Candidatus Igneacidithiobacillus taiwanensis]
MKLRAVILATMVGAISLPVFAAPAATVNGHAIENSQVQEIMDMSPDLAKQPNAREQVVQNLINMEVLSQYADQHGLAQTPAVEERLSLAKRQILADAAVDSYIKAHPITDAATQDAYNKFVAAMGKKEYEVRHILVKTKAEADQILAKLKAGQKFSTLAEKYSIDKGSAAHGGELGWIVPGMVVPPFAQAVETAPIDKPVGPIQTQFGYHIIEVQATRPVTPPSFASMKQRIKAQLQQQEAAKFVSDLRSKANINITK